MPSREVAWPSQTPLQPPLHWLHLPMPAAATRARRGEAHGPARRQPAATPSQHNSNYRYSCAILAEATNFCSKPTRERKITRYLKRRAVTPYRVQFGLASHWGVRCNRVGRVGGP